MADLQAQLDGKRLITAQIYYHFPDYPRLLQEYLWQDYDLLPYFPELRSFLDFWCDKIEGKLHSVHVAHLDKISGGKASHSIFDGYLH
jgi:uncharacterized protein Usg